MAGMAVTIALEPQLSSNNELRPPQSASGELSPLKRCKSSHQETSCPYSLPSPQPGNWRASPPPAMGTAMMEVQTDFASLAADPLCAFMESPATANAFGVQGPSAAVPLQRPGDQPTRQRSFSASVAQPGDGVFDFDCARGTPMSLSASLSAALPSLGTPSLTPSVSSVAPLLSPALLKSQPDAAARMARLAAAVEAKARMPESAWASANLGGDPSGSAPSMPPPEAGPMPEGGDVERRAMEDKDAGSGRSRARWAKQFTKPKRTPPRTRRNW